MHDVSIRKVEAVELTYPAVSEVSTETLIALSPLPYDFLSAVYDSVGKDFRRGARPSGRAPQARSRETGPPDQVRGLPAGARWPLRGHC